MGGVNKILRNQESIITMKPIFKPMLSMLLALSVGLSPQVFADDDAFQVDSIDETQPIASSKQSENEKEEAEEESFWEVDVGFVYGFSRNSIGAMNSNASINFFRTPWLAGGYYNGDFFVETDPANGKFLTVGYTVLENEKLQVNLIATPYFIGFDEEAQQSGDMLSGLEERSSSLDAGFEASYTHDIGQFGVRFVHDSIGTHNGYALAFAYGLPIYLDKMAILPSINITYISQSATDYYYGIRPQEVRRDRHVYVAESGLITKLNLYMEYELDDRTSLIGFGHVALSNDGINDSPIVTYDSSFVMGMGVIWTF